jgi:hypothetical protein
MKKIEAVEAKLEKLDDVFQQALIKKTSLPRSTSYLL